MTNDRCPPENPMTDIAALRENERRFPIMGGPSVPWSFVAPHARQAKENHDQTLERLAARGGLDPSELWCVVHSKAWHERASREVCDAWLREQVSLIAAYAAERDAALSEIEQLRAEVGRLLAFEVRHGLTLADIEHPDMGWNNVKTTNAVRTERDSARAEASRLKALVVEACDLAEEGWEYAADYFNQKWEPRPRLAAIRAEVERSGT